MEGVTTNIDPSNFEKIPHALKAPRAVKRITFNPSEANPGETLYVYVPKLNENEVIVPKSLALVFDISLSGGEANNFLVQKVSRALVDKLVVKFGGAQLDQTVGYDNYKIFQDVSCGFLFHCYQTSLLTTLVPDNTRTAFES